MTATNERSIFNESGGRLDNCDSVVNPVPKSSVQRHPNAARPQTLQILLCALGFGEHRRLRQFDLQTLATQTRRLDRRQCLVDEPCRVELHGGYVDRQRHRTLADRLPGQQSLQHGSQHEWGECIDPGVGPPDRPNAVVPGTRCTAGPARRSRRPARRGAGSRSSRRGRHAPVRHDPDPDGVRTRTFGLAPRPMGQSRSTPAQSACRDVTSHSPFRVQADA